MDDVFRSYIIPAIIAAIVALVSSIFTAIITYKTTKQMIEAENQRLKLTLNESKTENAKQLSIEYISNERIRWIQELRGTLADFRAHTTEVAFKCRKANGMVQDYSFEINKEAAYLKLLLKGYGQKELNIKKHIDAVITALTQINSNTRSMEPYFDSMEDLTKEVQIYLKIEWERVKVEVRGGTWTREKESDWEEKLELLYGSLLNSVLFKE